MIDALKRMLALALAVLGLSAAPALATQSALVLPIVGPMSMGTFVNTHLNPALQSLAQCHSGSSSPTNGAGSAPFAWQCWIDTSANPAVAKFFDGTSWIAWGTFNSSTHVFQGSNAREVLSATRTYYVRTDGNDNCSGLTDAAGAAGACAFLTWQKVSDVIASLDCAGQQIVAKQGSQTFPVTYAGSVTVSAAYTNCSPQFIGDNSTSVVTITNASPAVVSQTAHGLSAGARVIFSTSVALPTGINAGQVYFVIAGGLTANAFEISKTLAGSAVNTSSAGSGAHSVAKGLDNVVMSANVPFNLQGGAKLSASWFKFSGGNGPQARDGGTVFTCSAVEFAGGGYHFFTSATGKIACSNYLISASASGHWAGNALGFFSQSGYVTLANTPAFSSAFLNATLLSSASSSGVVFNGSATGNRCSISYGSNIQTNGGGAQYFPGNVDCSAAAGNITTNGTLQ